ncbi:hypothetical protein BABINDRAFT_32983 [Babjeviella inositovora NRRL Y-12698]|uniref:Carboxypeptidase Y n=1 Tax=Babjeviella inositovora NRRL Y-12698 TaxID=984486 RepID=A0A1E3QWJ1_9ASCO|nr:uncharacterized protein BABINDRAFT_32983 [Babjeviella inositovora NRRL Y-12698]ODQ82059.1 hypothetical protein BABINDRAFT_32983 [Babjeviella inositovora NRRL Y-12698]
MVAKSIEKTKIPLEFPYHSLRVTNPEGLGIDPSVKQHSGYLDILDEDKHFFYYFVESRNDPLTDPVLLWINGGPGCSSMTGLFFELGPAKISQGLKPIHNPHSWNSNASVIFLEQPVGVGYSYSSGSVISTEASAADMYAFMELFFARFPHFRLNNFHISGELYAGHYIPQFAAEILKHPHRTFNLSSVIIGNGITDSLTQYAWYEPMACGRGGYHAVLSPEKCASMRAAYPACAQLVQHCYDDPSVFTCVPADVYCLEHIKGALTQETDLNPYDLRRKCMGDGCYVEGEYITAYMNLDEVKKALGADTHRVFQLCSNDVLQGFIGSGDRTKPYMQYVAQVLDAGIPVLLYAGDKDYQCNWMGNLAWAEKLQYKHHKQFHKAQLRPWYNGEVRAGEVKSYDKFTYLRVFDAGHMVPFDQPENSLDMVNRWIAGDYLFGY